MGKWKDRIDKPLNLKWTNQEVKSLGVYVGNDRKQASLRTFSEIKDKIKNKISYWNNKSISLKGKVKILNIFVLAKLWYALECHDIAKDLISDINNLIKTFIWKGFHQRQFSVLNHPYNKGGLSLQSIEYKIESLRIKWIEKLMTSQDLFFERKIVNKLLGNNGNMKGLKIILYKKDLTRGINNSFYKNAYFIWKKYNVRYEPQNLNVIKNDWIYDNILLTDDEGRVFKSPGYYTEANTPTYVPKYFKDLPVQIPLRDMTGIFRTLIPKLNKAYHRIKYTNSEHGIF